MKGLWDYFSEDKILEIIKDKKDEKLIVEEIYKMVCNMFIKTIKFNIF